MKCYIKSKNKTPNYLIINIFTIISKHLKNISPVHIFEIWNGLMYQTKPQIMIILALSHFSTLQITTQPSGSRSLCRLIHKASPDLLQLPASGWVRCAFLCTHRVPCMYSITALITVIIFIFLPHESLQGQEPVVQGLALFLICMKHLVKFVRPLVEFG